MSYTPVHCIPGSDKLTCPSLLNVSLPESNNLTQFNFHRAPGLLQPLEKIVDREPAAATALLATLCKPLIGNLRDKSHAGTSLAALHAAVQNALTAAPRQVPYVSALQMLGIELARASHAMQAKVLRNAAEAANSRPAAVLQIEEQLMMGKDGAGQHHGQPPAKRQKTSLEPAEIPKAWRQLSLLYAGKWSYSEAEIVSQFWAALAATYRIATYRQYHASN